MNKIMFVCSFAVFVLFINFGTSTKNETNDLRKLLAQVESKNSDTESEIKRKSLFKKQVPVSLSSEYALVMNQVRGLETFSGANMTVQLDGAKDAEDISSQYVDTEFKGVKGLKIKIVVDKYSKETDMAAVLDDIHILEKNTDFRTDEINKDTNNLVVKGEIYGL